MCQHSLTASVSDLHRWETNKGHFRCNSYLAKKNIARNCLYLLFHDMSCVLTYFSGHGEEGMHDEDCNWHATLFLITSATRCRLA